MICRRNSTRPFSPSVGEAPTPSLLPTVAAARATPTTSRASPVPTPTLSAAQTVARLPASPALTPATFIPPATVMAHPRAWTVVARREDRQLFVTEPFTVQGPWRICWTLADTQRTFQLMVGDVGQATWELLSGPTGVPAGAFDLAQGGTFQRMFHNDTPYTAAVVERPGGGLPGAVAPPPCGN